MNEKADKMAEIVGDAYDIRYTDKSNVLASALCPIVSIFIKIIGIGKRNI